jgi:hypothetical protein
MSEIAIKDSWKPQGGRNMEAAWAYYPILFPTEIAALYRICGKELTNHLGIKLSMSTAFHPQADGQQDDWAELLPLAEHTYNASVSETTLQDVPVLRELRLPTRDAVDPTSSVGGELHQPRERVASSTLEMLAASRMPEIAIEHYRESRIPGRRLNEREKRMEYLVFWKGYPPEEATWEPWGESRRR